MRPKPPTARQISIQASCSAVRRSGLPLSERTKKSKWARSPERSSDSYVARSPAKTRVTSSLAIGMMTAVRADGSIGASGAALREIRWRSPPLASTRKPIIAVQNPADTHENRIANRARMATSSGSAPWYGSTLAMKYVATVVWATTSPSRNQRRCEPAGCHLPSASGPSCRVSQVSGTGGRPVILRQVLRSQPLTTWGGHWRGTIDARSGFGPVSTRTVPSSRRCSSGSPSTCGLP
ncbi:hypothetical protein D3C81_1450940 [compost metagenome]